MIRSLFCAALLCPLGVLAQPEAPATAPPPPPPPYLAAPATPCAPGAPVRIPGRRLGSGGRVKVYGLTQTLNLRAQRIDGAITFRMPANITGEPDRRVSVVYLRNGSRRSNTVGCAFRATRETRTIKLSAFKVVDCGRDAQDTNTSMGGLASCRHVGAGRSGSDTWRVPALAKGWVVQKVIFEDVSQGGRVALKAPEYVAGAAADLRMDWSIVDGHAEYRFAVRIEGPRGTAPHAKTGARKRP